MHFKETKHTKCKLTNSASTDIGQPTYLLMEKLWQFIVLKCKTVYTAIPVTEWSLRES